MKRPTRKPTTKHSLDGGQNTIPNISWIEKASPPISCDSMPRNTGRGRHLPWTRFGLLACLLLMLGCATESPPPDGPPAPRAVRRDRGLFPLDEGRIWVFVRPRVDRRVTVRAAPALGATRLEVVGPEDTVFAKMAWMGNDLLMAGPGSAPAVLLRLPAREGAEWVAAPGLRARVLADERVSVPAGDFHCVVVRFVGEGLRETYWMAPGVGFVRILREKGDVRDEAALIRYARGTTR